MRTSIYTFLLLTALILTPCASHAGVDDSDLKLFSLTGDKLLGMTNEGFNEDTQFGAVCTNLFNTGNGLINWFEKVALFTTAEILITDFFSLSDATGLKFYYGVGGGVNAGIHMTDLLGNYKMVPSADYSIGFIYAFVDTSEIYILNQASCYKYSPLSPGSPSKVTLASVVFPIAGATAWNNRIWIAGNSGQTLYWSSAASKADFVAATSRGGALNFYEAGKIFKIVGTNYGLYVFAANGIFMINGGPEFASWQINKIGGHYLDSDDGIFEYKNTVVFRTANPDRAVYQINGTSINKLFISLQDDASTVYGKMRVLNDRFFVFADNNDDDDYYYDIQNKSWGRFSKIKRFDDNFQSVFYLADTPSTSECYIKYYPDFTPAWGNTSNSIANWEYQTAWHTLDGNNSNQKEIKRVEIDYFGLSDATIEARLYFAYGTGENYLSKFFPGFSGGEGSYNGKNPMSGTFIWNVNTGFPTRKIYMTLASGGTHGGQILIKGIRIYYKELGNYKGRGTR